MLSPSSCKEALPSAEPGKAEGSGSPQAGQELAPRLAEFETPRGHPSREVKQTVEYMPLERPGCRDRLGTHQAHRAVLGRGLQSWGRGRL